MPGNSCGSATVLCVAQVCMCRRVIGIMLGFAAEFSSSAHGPTIVLFPGCRACLITWGHLTRYEYVNSDDCWMLATRDANGNQVGVCLGSGRLFHRRHCGMQAVGCTMQKLLPRGASSGGEP